MSDLRTAAQQALEALEGLSEPYHVLKAQDDLRTALAQQEQEPVAWMRPDETLCVVREVAEAEGYQPLYTDPPRREWQSLTEEEIRELTFHNQRTLWPRPDRSDVRATAIPFARAVEQALKERNNG